jgi:AraC-like DNA-binding protein
MYPLYFRRMNYIIAIGMVQAVIALLLLGGNGKNTENADRLLMLLMACIATHLAIKFAIFNWVNDELVRYKMNTFIGYCYGPVIYLYALQQRDSNTSLLNKGYLFIPFLLACVGYLTVVSVLRVSAAIGHETLNLYNNVTGYTLPLFNFVFSVLTIRTSIKLRQSSIKNGMLIRNISILLGILSLIGIVFMPFAASMGATGNVVIRSVCYLLLGVICVLILRYKFAAGAIPGAAVNEEDAAVGELNKLEALDECSAVEEMSEFPESSYESVAEGPAPVFEENLRKVQLSVDQHQEIFSRLENYLEKSRAFADAELTIEKLAAGIGVSRYNLSETLNYYAGKTFYQYVNEWRIRNVAQQIEDLAEKKIPVNFLILAYDNGFKAKSSFNAYFKKLMGCTPTDYLKQSQPAALH